MSEVKKPTGRPPKPMPELIDDSPEHVALAIFNTPPKRADDWKFLKESPRD